MYVPPRSVTQLDYGSLEKGSIELFECTERIIEYDRIRFVHCTTEHIRKYSAILGKQRLRSLPNQFRLQLACIMNRKRCEYTPGSTSLHHLE